VFSEQAMGSVVSQGLVHRHRFIPSPTAACTPRAASHGPGSPGR